VQQHLAAVAGDAPGRQHRLARLAEMQPLGDAVNEEIDDVEFGEVARREGFVLGPQPLRDLAHRRPAQQRAALLVGEHRLDVARREAAGIHLDRERLQLLAASTHHLANARAKRFGAVGDLRRAVLDRPLGALQTPGPVAVAVARSPRRAARIVAAAKRVRSLALQRLLDDQPRRQADQLRALAARLAPALHQRLQLLARPIRCRYPLHRGAPSSDDRASTRPSVTRLSGEGAPRPLFQQR
jgi:hypothetical protein